MTAVASLIPLSALCAAQQAALPSAVKPTPTVQTYFFVGGKYVKDGERQFMAGQMYVQQFSPAKVTHRWPVVMIHGTAQTGNNFLATPDGRQGWANDFLAKGFNVYIVDQVGRARSGAAPESYGPYMRFSVRDLEEIFTGQENFKLFPQASLHTQWPGGPGVAGNPSFDQFYASQVESIANGVKTEELNDAAIIALLEKIGPAILLTHSQSGVFGWKVADMRPDLVKGIVAVEPNGPPFYDPIFLGGADWYKDSEKPSRAWGITRIPLSFDPPASEPSQLGMVREAAPDTPNHVRCWLQGNPARQLPRMQGIPIAIVTGEASFRATLDHCTSKFLTQAGVKNTHIRLENENVHGNGHMMMLEKNSSQIAQVLIRWINVNVK
jgi:pimeloyl-ACP methyl ester carboxylesterase